MEEAVVVMVVVAVEEAVVAMVVVVAEVALDQMYRQHAAQINPHLIVGNASCASERSDTVPCDNANQSPRSEA